MAYIQARSEELGGATDATLDGAADAAMEAADGTLAGSFKAQGIMTEGVIKAGSLAATNSSFNQGAGQAANK